MSCLHSVQCVGEKVNDPNLIEVLQQHWKYLDTIRILFSCEFVCIGRIRYMLSLLTLARVGVS